MSVATQEATPAAAKPAKKKTKRGPEHRPGLNRWLPYLLLAPAVLAELLIHIIPMLVGIWMSFVKLTKFFIANWSAAPWAGLNNYRVAVDVHDPAVRILFLRHLVHVRHRRDTGTEVEELPDPLAGHEPDRAPEERAVHARRVAQPGHRAFELLAHRTIDGEVVAAAQHEVVSARDARHGDIDTQWYPFR